MGPPFWNQKLSVQSSREDCAHRLYVGCKEAFFVGLISVARIRMHLDGAPFLQLTVEPTIPCGLNLPGSCLAP